MNRPPQRRGRRQLGAASLAALGVVFGDLGTSPLYALHETFAGSHPVAPTRDNILGVLSLFIWSLVVVVSGKYLALLMRADNRGEGGIFALLALTRAAAQKARVDERGQIRRKRIVRVIVFLGIAGAALLYGDGVITPAISVLSAVEGLAVAAPQLHHWVVPLTVIVLVLLFYVQPFGSGRIGQVFGPVLALWFVVIAAIGVRGIAQAPGVLRAFDPTQAVGYFVAHGWRGFTVLGAVVLCLTGGEALYADMGHFGRTPIRVAWFGLTFPCLLLNYLGQGGVLLTNAAAVENPFYRAAPQWSLYPLVGLATVATVIASQALITAVFSLTSQAVQLGLSPRLRIVHTSSHEIGQIYLPALNWVLMLACLALVVGFRSSTRLAAAYGWIPLVIGAVVFLLLDTWYRGRQLLRLNEASNSRSAGVEALLASLRDGSAARVRGTAVYMHSVPRGVPRTLLHNLKHNRVLHERVIFLTAVTEDVSFVPLAERVEVTVLAEGFWRVVGHYGFRQEPDVPDILELAAAKGLEFRKDQTTYFLGHETIISAPKPGMARWRERLFGIMVRNARPATAYFRLPPNRVVELGTQVEI